MKNFEIRNLNFEYFEFRISGFSLLLVLFFPRLFKGGVLLRKTTREMPGFPLSGLTLELALKYAICETNYGACAAACKAWNEAVKKDRGFWETICKELYPFAHQFTRECFLSWARCDIERSNVVSFGGPVHPNRPPQALQGLQEAEVIITVRGAGWVRQPMDWARLSGDDVPRLIQPHIELCDFDMRGSDEEWKIAGTATSLRCKSYVCVPLAAGWDVTPGPEFLLTSDGEGWCNQWAEDGIDEEDTYPYAEGRSLSGTEDEEDEDEDEDGEEWSIGDLDIQMEDGDDGHATWRDLRLTRDGSVTGVVNGPRVCLRGHLWFSFSLWVEFGPRGEKLRDGASDERPAGRNCATVLTNMTLSMKPSPINASSRKVCRAVQRFVNEDESETLVLQELFNREELLGALGNVVAGRVCTISTPEIRRK